MIETREIKMPSKKMLLVLFLESGILWTVIAFAGFVTFIILGFALNFRFFLLALIWIFLLIPLVVAFLYFYYGMDPLTAFNSIPHKICFNDKDIEVKLLVNEGEEKESKSYSVDKELFKEIKSGANYFLMFFKQRGWLWVPVESFSSLDECRRVIDSLNLSHKDRINE